MSERTDEIKQQCIVGTFSHLSHEEWIEACRDLMQVYEQAERERAALQVRIDRADGALADAATVQTDDLERGIRQLTNERDALQAECQRLKGLQSR